MKPAPFEYQAPATLREAIDLLGGLGTGSVGKALNTCSGYHRRYERNAFVRCTIIIGVGM
jgi:hypothetical protein